MLRRKSIIVLAVLCAAIFTSTAQAQLPNISTGLSYLTSSQNSDGTWQTSTSQVETTVATVSALETLKLLNQTAGTPYTTGISWLQAQTPQSVDYIAERIHALNLPDGSPLIPARDTLGGAWGGYDEYETNLLDTSLALQALKSANYSDLTVINPALAYLTTSQNPDGGWGFSKGDTSNVYMTAVVSATLQQFPQMNSIAAAVTKATAFLIAHQNPDGGFGSSPSTVYETALAYAALAAVSNNSGVLGNAVNYLTSTQSANGSWNDDPYSTALALKALYLSENRPSPPPPPPAGGTVTGTVIDAVTKQPLNSVAVVLESNNLISTVTDATGAFTLKDVPPGSQKVNFSLSGYASASASITSIVNVTANLGNVQMVSAYSTGTIAGTVSDASGKPLAGVAITITGAWSGSATTGTDGSYSFTYVPPGQMTITAAKAGFQTVTSQGTVYARTTLTFSPRLGTTPPTLTTGTLVGRVVDSYLGLPMDHLPGEQGMTVTVSGGISVEADPDNRGYFQITGLAPGTYQVMVGTNGYAYRTFRVVITPGGITDLGTIKIERSFAMTLTGKITDAGTGAPLPGAEVTLQGTDFTGRTDNSGTYAIGDIPYTGQYTVKAKADGYIGKSYTIGASSWLQPMDIALSPLVTKGSITGTVVDATTGQPLNGVALALAGDPAVSAATNSTGAFTLTSVPPGSQQVTLALGGYATRTLTTAITVGAVSNVGTIPLSATPLPASIRGTVRDAVANAPFVGVQIQATGTDPQQTVTAVDGTYSMDGVTPGTVTVAATSPKPGYFGARFTGLLEPGGVLVFSPVLSTTVPATVNLAVQTDKTVYKKSDTVGVTVTLRNLQGVDVATSLRLRVVDPAGATAFDSAVDIPLAADGTADKNFDVTLPSTASPGTYTVLAELHGNNGAAMGSVAKSFGVAVSQISVTPALPATFSAGANTLSFTLVNSGTIAVTSGTLGVTFKDPDGQLVASATQPFSLSVGESRLLTSTLSIPPLKFGTYTLTYVESDETAAGQPTNVILPNSIAIVPLFDNTSYRIRETANLTVTVNNTGRFNLDAGILVTAAVPIAGYGETKTLTPAPVAGSAAGSGLIYQFAIPDTMTAGLHAAKITVALPSGSTAVQTGLLAIPESSLSLSLVKIAYVAGETVQPVVANGGGVDTPVQYTLTLYDAKSTQIAQKSATETAVAGSTLPLSLAIPAGAVDGAYNLVVAYKDTKTGKEAIVQNPITVSGVKGTLQVQTGKQTYLLTENITDLGTITNSGTVPMSGNVHLQVVTGPGSEKQKTWTTQADFQTGVRNGVDTYGVNDWIIPDDDFDGTAIDVIKWADRWGKVSIQSGTLLVDATQPAETAGGSGVQSNWMLEGDFDIQVDFSSNNSGYWVGAQMYASVGGAYINIANSIGPGYASQVGGVDVVQGPFASGGTPSTSGKFRITRSSNRVETYYWGGASWVAVLNYTSPLMANPARIGLAVWRGPGYSGASAAFDNFKVNSGRIKTENQPVDSVRLMPLSDNFDNGIINTERWVFKSEPGYLPTESNGTLRMLSPPNPTYLDKGAFFTTSQPITGDFDVAFDFNVLSQWQSPENDTIDLSVSTPFYWMRVFLQRARWYSGPIIGSVGATNQSIWTFAQNATPKGKLRLTRVGSTYSSYYWNGNGWTKLYSETGRADGPTSFNMGVWNQMSPVQLEARLDNFIVQAHTYPASGTLKLKYDSGRSGRWYKLNYSADIPVGTSIKFRTRTAETEAGLATATWSDYLTANGSSVASPPGQWIEVETTLATTDTNVTPLLHDLTVTYEANPGQVLWQTDVPVNLLQGVSSTLNNTIGTLGVTGKLYLQGALTSTTGQTVASAEYPFYVEQGNIQLLLAPDKKVYRPGETVTVTGTVNNLSSVATTGLLLRVPTPGSTTGTLYTETFDLPANGSHPFSFTTVAGAIGTYRLSGSVTQNGTTLAEIADQYETASPVATATLTAPDTVGSAPFVVTLALSNTGKVDTVTNVQVTDDSGVVIDSQQVTILAGQTRVLSYSRQITGTATYTAVLTGDITQTLTKTVKMDASAAVLQAGSSVNAKVVTDRISYNPNDQATLTATVTAGVASENLSVVITVSNSQGQALYSATTSLPALVQGQTTTINKYWNVGANPAGSYLVTLQILDAVGMVIAKTTCNLAIASITTPTALLKGQLTLGNQHILTGEPVTVSYNVTNTGNIDLSAIPLAIQTVHMVEQTVYNTITDQSSLAMGAGYANNGRIDTQGYSAKDYLVVLRATIDGVEETLAGTYFRVEGAPSAPALSGPANGADVETFTPLLAVSNAADPNDDKLTYEFEVYGDSGLTNLVTSGTVPELTGSTSWIVPVPLTENQTCFWRARAYDGRLYGPWMEPASFRVNTVNDPPSAPTLASPADGTAVAVLTPVLTVNNATDPDSANLTYNFDVALDPAFTQIVASQKGIASGQGTTPWTVPVSLLENGMYYWRAQADDWLIEGPWSAVGRFLVNLANDPPSVPVVTAPVNGATVASLATDIVVTNSSDPDSSTIIYYFEADTVPSFDSANIIRSGSVTEGQGTTFWQLSGLLDNTPYYLRVKASDSIADSPWSTVTDFFVTTVNDPPTVPVLVNPSSGGGVNVFTPTLAVRNSTDLDRDVLTYEFEVYGDAAMTNVVAHASGITETVQVTTWVVPVSLAENQTYYWRARAYDGSLYSDWMPATSFMVNTANDAPGVPGLSSPVEGSSVATLTPTLAVMNAIDPDSDNLTYDFEVYAAASLVAAISGVPGNNAGITTWTPGAALADNTVYQWRARAYDGDRYGPWTAMATFTVHIPKTSINATINFDPNTLNASSKGTWVTVYIELPDGFKPADIDITSIRLEGAVPAETRPYAIGDYDKDGIPDLMVKFRRPDVINLLQNGEAVPVHVTGKVGATPFEGVDVIRVIK